MGYQSGREIGGRNIETKSQMRGKSLSNLSSGIDTNIVEESTTDNNRVCTRDPEKENAEKSETRQSGENCGKNTRLKNGKN